MGAVALALVSVLLLNLYAAVMVVVRGRSYGVRVYRPMLWNIFLSLAPVIVVFVGIVALLLVAGATNRAFDAGSDLAGVMVWVFWGVMAVSALVWILAFPNSAYLITELNMSHRRSEDPVPLWYDIVSVLTLTLSGIANAVLSLGIIQFFWLMIADTHRIGTSSWVFAMSVLALGSFGVYLGRYLRFNSWDIRHPASFVRKFFGYFAQAGHVRDAAVFVLAHTILLALVYVPLFVLAHAAVIATSA